MELHRSSASCERRVRVSPKLTYVQSYRNVKEPLSWLSVSVTHNFTHVGGKYWYCWVIHKYAHWHMLFNDWLSLWRWWAHVEFHNRKYDKQTPFMAALSYCAVPQNVEVNVRDNYKHATWKLEPEPYGLIFQSWSRGLSRGVDRARSGWLRLDPSYADIRYPLPMMHWAPLSSSLFLLFIFRFHH